MPCKSGVSESVLLIHVFIVTARTSSTTTTTAPPAQTVCPAFDGASCRVECLAMDVKGCLICNCGTSMNYLFLGFADIFDTFPINTARISFHGIDTNKITLNKLLNILNIILTLLRVK